MAKNLCGLLTHVELTKRPAATNKFVTPELDRANCCVKSLLFIVFLFILS